MTLREFLCLIGAAIVYVLAFLICWLLGVNRYIELFTCITLFVGSFIALDEITNKHRHGEWK